MDLLSIPTAPRRRFAGIFLGKACFYKRPDIRIAYHFHLRKRSGSVLPMSSSEVPLSPHLRIAVGVATAGRRDLLSAVLLEIARQVRLPDIVVICPAASDDFDNAIQDQVPYEIKTVCSAPGLTTQRNAILDVTSRYDVIVFFDDDFLPSRSYLEDVEICFSQNNEVVAASGLVLADGITGPGIELAAARAILERHALGAVRENGLKDQYNAYGCNMALRLMPVRKNELRFDENLPFYGWLEDVDFCRRLAEFGRIVKDSNLSGVHLGTKGGRTSGVRFGYSQIANPVYLWRKGTVRFDRAFGQIAKNVASNLRKSVNPEPWTDRGGRVRGNVRAFYDLLRGRLDPRRIRELGK
jgi:GT2 family glycosyltransferase